MEQIAFIGVLIVSVVLHEMAHGYAANAMGDPTARLQGRLSGNPLVHIDPIGSVLVPAFLILTNAQFLFGWAKPVPYNPYNLRNQKWGEALVAAAGPATNVLLAIVFAVIVRSADVLNLSASFVELSAYIVYINILLAFFNLIPFPPLDGSKILTALLPLRARMNYQNFLMKVQSFGLLATFLLLFIMIQILWVPFATLVGYVFMLFTGMRMF